MSAHGLGPVTEWNAARLAPAVQIEPVEDRLRRFSSGAEVPRQIGEPLIVLEKDVAMPDTGPQARLAFDPDIVSSPGSQDPLNFGDQHFTARAAVGTGLRFAAVAARGAENEGSHKARLEIAIDGRGSPMGKIAEPVNLQPS